MNLMTLVRLLGLLVIGWMVLALGAGTALGVGADERTNSTYFLPRPSLEDAIPLGRIEGPRVPDYRLVDRTTGEIKPLVLPQEPAWTLLSVSPWRDRDGNLEAVGRWVSRLEGPVEFCGLGLLGLHETTVKNRVTLDVLPTGKPCWIPDRPGEILFPAADGKLYRCNVAGHDRENMAADSAPSGERKGGNSAGARAVTWEVRRPGSGPVHIADPTCSPEPDLRHLVFVSLSLQRSLENGPVILPPKVWWLILNDEGDAVVAAGRLSQSEPDELRNDIVFERMPNVFIDGAGKPRLLYLSRTTDEKVWQLRSARLEFAPETSLPRIRKSEGESTVLAVGLAPASLVVSADGKSVYATGGSGQTLKHSIPR